MATQVYKSSWAHAVSRTIAWWAWQPTKTSINRYKHMLHIRK